MAVPTNLEFANEVKADRLKVLWRLTLILSVILGWIVLNIAMLQRQEVTSLMLPLVVLAVGCLLTRVILNRGQFTTAAWIYTLGAIAAIALGIALGDNLLRQILPFAFPVVVFVVGLLVHPLNALLFGIVASMITVLVPGVVTGSFEFFGIFQIAAIIVIFLSALLAMQVTGDLSQVTEWALMNYQRERRVSSELFDNRQQLERSLARSQALSDRLQQANTDLVAARAAAEEAKHFRGQFLANMSHELRTPLNAIIGFSETMLKYPAMYDGVKLPNAYEADLQQIYNSGRQLLNLINDILDLSKVDAGKLDIRMGRIELKPLVTAVLSTAGGLVGQKPIRLELDLPPIIPDVFADEARVRQVLLNLYSNAAKFTDRGAITLSVRETEEGVLVSVRDTGSGIPKDSLEVIFEEFKQAETGVRDPRSGAGLGLAISRQLLGLMGGRIWAESEMGRGSILYFTLQRYRENIENEFVLNGNGNGANAITADVRHSEQVG
ncbi:MAG: ATP-binding protein [bacterium]|nr:ATP-binding protein [bacterium]